MISGQQCRMARAGLGLDRNELARRVGTTAYTIGRFEDGKTRPRTTTLDAIRAELERAGMRFTFHPDGRPLGVEIAHDREG